ncbi:MAG: hypothetical protein NUV74_13620 [Candidatus Brocadiaceae bacterium]|nr:hypothetical protein [Candidatus Brocadiaceae bacterium]
MNRTVDLDKIKEIALKGIQRTTIFLGLGINAARDEKLIQYQLPENHFLKMVQENASEEQVNHFKQNFEKWIISNGLRELIETFGLFLDKIHQTCLLFATSKTLISSKDANTFGPAFEKKGVEGKLHTLRTRFDIQTNKENYFASINQARNCITHRQGRIGLEDLKGKNSFGLTWWTLNMVAQMADGKEVSLTPMPKEGFFFKEAGTIGVKILDRLREFKKGEIIELTPTDINEICFLVYMATNDIVTSTMNYANK